MKWIIFKGFLYTVIAQRYTRRGYEKDQGTLWEGWFKNGHGHIIKVQYLASTCAYWLPGHSKTIIQNQPHPSKWVRWIVPENYLL